MRRSRPRSAGARYQVLWTDRAGREWCLVSVSDEVTAKEVLRNVRKQVPSARLVERAS